MLFLIYAVFFGILKAEAVALFDRYAPIPISLTE